MLTAVVVTALPVEYAAVRAHLGQLEEKDHKGTVFEVGVFKHADRIWQVAIALTGAGNSPAAVVTERAISRFSPDVALFIGVAGGIKDVRVGDVVAATRIYGYESGKATEEFRPRGDAGRSSYRMVQRALAVAGRGDWRRRIKEPTDYTPNALAAPIAAGEKVVAATASETYLFIRNNYGAAVAVEMEGRGFTEATHANDDVQALVVRGISDLIDKKSDVDASGSQEIASRNAAAFAFEVLATLTLPSTQPDPTSRPISDPESQSGSEPKIEYPIRNLSHRRNPNFIGRVELIAQLQESLASSSTSHSDQFIALNGLGGMGKTQVAVEYAYRHAEAYDVIWWIRAEEASTLAADYASLARELGLPEAGIQDQATTIEATRQAQAGIIAAVRRWLERGGRRWLLVFDNANYWGDLDPYIPMAGGGHVVITTPNSSWPAQVQSVVIPVMPSTDAVTFLLSRTRQNDEDTAAALAGELGYLPLALEQAAAYVSARGLTLAGYLDRFRTQRKEVLKRGQPTGYDATVATTWELAFEGAADQAPAAANLLNIMAFLAPDAIPLESLIGNPEVLPEPLRATVKNQVALDDAVVALRRYSLVEALDDRTLSVHRLVQAVLQDRLTRDQQRAWAQLAVHVVAEALPDEGDDPRTWPAWERILSHALAVMKHCSGLELTGLEVAKLNARVGVHLSARGRSAEARPLLERSLAIVESETGPNDPELATGLHHLARVLKDLADLQGALQVLERAREIDEATYGTEHPEVANDHALMGNILRQQGKLVEAREWLVKALRIRTAVYGPNHPEVATAQNDLGNVLRSQGDYDGARRLQQSALQIHKTAYGPDHPEIGIDLGNLGQDLQRLGDLALALEMQKQSLEIHESLYGPDHPMVAIALGNLGRVLRDQGKLTDARQCFERALAIDEAVYGANHPHVAAALDNLGNQLQAEGNLAEAKPLYQRALDIREAAFGANHHEVASSLNNLATLLERQGELPEARAKFRRAIAIGETALGSNHPSMAIYSFNFANVLKQEGCLAEARQLLDRTLQIYEATGSCDQVDLANTLSALANVQWGLGDLIEARRTYQRALTIWRNIGNESSAEEILRFLRIIDEQHSGQ